MMDVVIADVPPTYGMLLSRHWGTYFGGSIQFDFEYATIPVFGGGTFRLYREPKMTYVISNPDNPSNFIPIVLTYIGNFILSYESAPCPPTVKQGLTCRWVSILCARKESQTLLAFGPCTFTERVKDIKMERGHCWSLLGERSLPTS